MLILVTLIFFISSAGAIHPQNDGRIHPDSIRSWTKKYLIHTDDSTTLYRKLIDSLPSQNILEKENLLVRALQYLSLYYEKNGDLDTAIYFLETMGQIYKQNDAIEELADNYLHLKSIYSNKADYAAAQQQVFSALEIYERIPDRRGIAKCYTHLCDLLYYEDKYQESIDYCDKAIEIQNSLKEYLDLALSYQYKASSQLFAEVPLDSALQTINRAIDLYQDIGEQGVPLLASINGRGNILKYMKNYEAALADYSDVFTRSEDLGLDRYSIPALGNIGHVYLLQKKYDEALKFHLQAIEKIKLSGHKNNLWENYMHVSEIYEKKNDYEQSLNYHKLFLEEYENYLYSIIDRLENEKQVKYEVSKKNELISKQESQIATQRKVQILYICLALLLISSLLGMYFSRNKLQRKQFEIEQSRKELSRSLEELKMTQSQLIQSEKMASLGELTAGIAHEIQNPLNFVNNFSEINAELIDELKIELEKGNYREAQDISGDIKVNEEKINHHGKRADAIVKSMLQHSRSSSGAKEPTDINALCDEYLRLAYHGFRAKDKSFSANFKLHLDESHPIIEVVPQDIGRVLLNLINNAFHAVSGVDKPEVVVSTKKLENAIDITVEDNGKGIPDEIKDKIFQPFFTTKAAGQGTGLGLSLAYDIVKAHRGELTMDSKTDQGTNFTITLPII